MATNFSIFRTHTFPIFTFYSPPRAAAAAAARFLLIPTAALSFSSTPYGPSLRKGHAPTPLELPKLQLDENIASLDEAAFTRVFEISALRVPSEVCSTLENRFRGHLLNWPRVKNIARVPGDEVDDQLEGVVFNSVNRAGVEGEDEKLVALNRRIYGKAEGDGEPLNEVLYRDKLVKTFDSLGYVNFRNLAKISRPKKKKKKKRGDGGDKREVKGIGRTEMAIVEVVEDCYEDCDDEDFSGLLGEDFGKRISRWRGSTRLLLLDEKYANKTIDELPEAIKVFFQERDGECRSPAFELVKCTLTLLYEYWPMNEVLEALLPNGMIIPSTFETVGHIAHLNLREEHLQYKSLIAKVVLDKNKPKIQTVVNKVDAIHNDYRTMQLEVLAGNNSLVTTVVENGLRFHVDLAAVYWNSRLGTERQRLLSCFAPTDVVCDVFAGVGPISISAAKKVKRVYANDLNPSAVEYLERNCFFNKVERKIEVFNMDGRRFIETVFSSHRAESITQVVMNLPKDAAEFLDVFRGVFQRHDPGKRCNLPRLHVYGFSKAEDPEFEFEARIRSALSEAAIEVEIHRVRVVAPGKWMLCASFILPERAAYSKTG
ncbi:tRNA (guanine(37)-N1)-methyltransferase 2 [Striga hermonthica]|uniref:tRNA (guanine(37)-N1)-methyltransferase n=1 Tax=Striga hermonthica TaxID=68872 RepID=A0A9N7MQ12_STRHE|nr:tRNA (guanine(37)-N1)-methyltransferase 2 [Striga hermonthica]